ncbi:MAG TPA: MBL fold metallo-hydrolase [Gemmatimonadaceae bacterium]|nr:MBL fold metallo-hydrolase [Gemmatimonadaceae bacterium]
MSESEHTEDSLPEAPPHHAPNGKFRNPWGLKESRFAGLLRWRWNRVRHPLPRDDGARSLQGVPSSVRVPRAPANEIAVTWVGHSTLLVQLGAINILTDPVWSDRASPWRVVGPRRLIPAALPLDALPPIDIVLLSHNHYDHLDAWSVRALARAQPTAQWVVPLRLGVVVRSLGVRYITELDWWDEGTVGDATVACTPARHFSARTPFDRNRTLWCGFAVASSAGRLFYAGDTGLHPEFARIGERFGPFVVSAIPIGAYEPRWFMQPVHVDPDDAITAFRALHAHHGPLARAVMVGVHWGTFRLTDEPILEPPRRIREAWKRAMLPEENLWVLAHGETRGMRTEQ